MSICTNIYTLNKGSRLYLDALEACNYKII